MIGAFHLKVCGQTRVEDARAAAEIGADYLGFILYPKSPRGITLARYAELAPELPVGPRRVAVMVEPSGPELAAAAAAGFDFFQIHCAHTTPLPTVQGWSGQVGAHRLWLAPKLPPLDDVPAEWLPLAATFLMDTFHAEGFGGSGKTGDWAKFARHRQANPQHTWILAGGLNPENIAEAVARSGAHFVDVNSGVESSPGVKDHAKLRRLAETLVAER
jgi:phosphoribosylanthranilate isomerase